MGSGILALILIELTISCLKFVVVVDKKRLESLAKPDKLEHLKQINCNV